MTRIDVRYEPEHDGSVMFDDQGTPFVQYGRHPFHGDGWTLYYLDHPESETAGVEEYFIPGDLTDVDAVVKSARTHMDWVREIES